MFSKSSPHAQREESRSTTDAEPAKKFDSTKEAVRATGNPHAEREGYKTIRIGDKDWATMPYNGVGGVFRIRPDGTNLRSFSRGLRNPCGLCFDAYGNLFTNDNDHEGLPSAYVPGRLLHVTEGAYFSWPRGWLQSKSPDRADILPSLNENLGRFVPVLQTYYGDDFLPEKYDNNLLVARWCRRQVTRFPLEAKGETYEAREFTAKEHVLLEGSDQARPVGVCVGRGGRVFVTICYMAQNEGSPVYRSDLAVITRKDDPDTMPFDGYEATAIDVSRLQDEFKSPIHSRSTAARQELLRRGQPFFKNDDDRNVLRKQRYKPLRSLAGDLGVDVSRDLNEMVGKLFQYLERLVSAGHTRFAQQRSSPESVGETSWEMDFLRNGRATECWGLVEEGLGRCGPKPGENILPP